MGSNIGSLEMIGIIVFAIILLYCAVSIVLKIASRSFRK